MPMPSACAALPETAAIPGWRGAMPFQVHLHLVSDFRGPRAT